MLNDVVVTDTQPKKKKNKERNQLKKRKKEVFCLVSYDLTFLLTALICV